MLKLSMTYILYLSPHIFVFIMFRYNSQELNVKSLFSGV